MAFQVALLIANGDRIAAAESWHEARSEIEAGKLAKHLAAPAARQLALRQYGFQRIRAEAGVRGA